MFMQAVPQFSSDQNTGIIEDLTQLLLQQQEDLTMLCTIVEYLKGQLQTGIENHDVQKYNNKVMIISKRQVKRYNEIDILINETIIQRKKGKITDETGLIYGKEVRKLESGLRTLKLFVSDAITMLQKNQKIESRSEERIRYFENRSASLQGEIITLTKQISLLKK